MSQPGLDWRASDEEQLARREISTAEADSQLARLRGGPIWTRLDRPCTAGDGLDRLGQAEIEAFERLAEPAIARGEMIKFVPASGAASRMFKDLLAARAGLQDAPGTRADIEEGVADWLNGIERFAFRATLAAALGESPAAAAARRDLAKLLDAVLSGDGLDYASSPKGLIEFHWYPDGTRTAFDEHLAEAVQWVRDAEDRCRCHFTVSPEHLAAFRERVAAFGGDLETRHGIRLEIDFSVQRPSTDTIAIGEDGAPFRLTDGTLLFRPAGHGALLANLQDIDADLFMMKNIDNVVPDHLKDSTLRWCRVLTGMLVDLRARVSEHLERLRAPNVPDVPDVPDVRDVPNVRDVRDSDAASAVEFARSRLNRAQGVDPSDRDAVIGMLDRPIRVCGMVLNEGEPGGGPFWVRNPDGVRSPQIVESAQVDPDDSDQVELLRTATHFNPVFIVGSRTDPWGRAYDLDRYIDPDTAIVTRKSSDGRELTALERPGLWNGSMAGWNTVFVEVPAVVFNPVKTVMDLLRPAHQPD